MGEALSRVFPGLVRALLKFQTRGPQALTDGNAQVRVSHFLSARESLEHGPGTSLRNSGIFSAEKSVLVWHRENRAQKIRPKIRPQIRPFESDAATSAGTLKANKPHLKGHGDPGCAEHCPQWFCNCASKFGDGEKVVPRLC